MPNMSEGYRNAIANHGASLITHIGLVDENGTELDGGGYARQAVTWTTAPASGVGVVRPESDLTFDVPAGKVAGWRGFDQLAHPAGTNYGGKALTEETFAAAGQYKLLAASTGILHNNA